MRQNLGQHFLRNAAVLKKIAELLSLQPGETVIEIGPGHGELTAELLAFDLRLIAVERDPELAEYARREFGGKIKVMEGDILKVLPRLASELKAESYKLVGNIPYYLTGYLLRTISELQHKPALTVLTIQKEVAERLAARPPEMNRLAAAVQFWAEPRIAGLISRRDFTPPPEVDSATVVLKTREPQAAPSAAAAYYAALRVLFRQPRKTIANNLSAGTVLARPEIELSLRESGLRPNLRPQDLSVENIRKLAGKFADKFPESGQ